MPTKQCTKCKEIKELTEFHKKKKSKDGLDSSCKKCNNIRSAAYKKTFTGKINQEKSNKKRRARPDVKEYLSKYHKEYFKTKEGRENHVRARKKYNSTPKRKIANAVQVSKRRATKLSATPRWLTSDHWIQIREFYIKAAKLTKETGILYHVDHIVPLLGKNVRGLHVPWNLQVIPALGPNGNWVKSNKFS